MLNDTIMREREKCISPPELGGFSVVYTNKPGGKSFTGLVFELFRHLPWEGVSAKVAIGCSPLIHGLLQIQLPGIHNRHVQQQSHTVTSKGTKQNTTHVCQQGVSRATKIKKKKKMDNKTSSQRGKCEASSLTTPTVRSVLTAACR